MKKKEHYIDNKQFQILLEKWLNNKDREAYQELGKIFLKIVNRLLMRPNFVNYTDDYKSEMISDATYYMVRYINRYDLNMKSPFAYFSEIAFKAFVHYVVAMQKKSQKFVSIEFIDNMSREGY